MLNNPILYSSSVTIPQEYPDIMTVPELAEYLGIGKNKAYDLLRNGTIKGFRIGASWKVSREAVDYYIRKKSGLI